MAAPGVSAPPKPWERTSSTSTSPFTPSSAAKNTASVVESAGVADPGEKNENQAMQSSNRAIGSRPMPPRPWERNNSLAGYNSTANYYPYSTVGSSLYGSSPYYGGYRGGYGYGGSYAGGLYGGGYGSYGGGMIGTGYGGMYGNGYGGMGMIGMGVPNATGYGQEDPNNPFGGGLPAGPPTFWQSMLKAMHGVVAFFGHISLLVDQNTQAFHFFITALLQLCDRTGMLYGEMARFVLRLLGIRRKKALLKSPSVPVLEQGKSANYFIEEPKEAGGLWDTVWTDRKAE